MKNVIQLGALAIMVVGLSACERTTVVEAPAAAPKSAPAPAAAPKKDEPAIQLEIKGSDGSLKINAD